MASVETLPELPQTEPPRPRESTLRRIAASRWEKWIRRLVLAGLLVLLAFYAGEIYRRARFFWTGTVSVDGMELHINPNDRWMTQVILKTGAWEPTETEALCGLLKPGDTFVDVGACFGYYTLLASKRVGPKGRVIAFEPDPDNFAILKHNVESNGCSNVVLVQKALSSGPGTLQLHVSRSNKGASSFFQSKDTEDEAAVVEVEALALDDYLKSTGGRIDLVKIDTEGAEGFILEGMQDTLRQHPGIRVIIEYYPYKLRTSGYDPAKILACLVKQGFAIRKIDERADTVLPVTAEELLADERLDRGGLTNLIFERAD